MAKRLQFDENDDVIASMKWRINNIIKNTKNQLTLQTLLHMNKDLIERKTSDLALFHDELVGYESQMLSYDAIKLRFQKVHQDLCKAVEFIQTVSQVAPSIFPLFDRAQQYMDTMRNMLLAIPDFDSIERDDYKDYLDLLHRLEDWLIDYSMYVKKMESSVKHEAIKMTDNISS